MNYLRLLFSNFWILLVVSFSLVAVSLPIYNGGLSGIFYSIDPDVVYAANALSFINNGVIGYFDHPGTPAIKIISYYYIPLRVIAKFYLHQPFTAFSFEYLKYVFAYTRFMQSLLFSLGIFLVALSAKNTTKIKTLSLLTVPVLFCFTPVYFAVNSISAEPLMVLLCGVWIWIFSKYLVRKEIGWVYIMVFLSGLLFANRATTLFYLISSIGLLLMHDRSTVKHKIIRVVSSLIIFVASFLLGVFPFTDKAWHIISRVLFFASSTGVHGSTTQLSFVHSYLESVKMFLVRDPALVAVFGFALAVAVANIRKNMSFVVVAASCVLGILTIAKFPLAHYQLPNYILGVYILIANISTNKRFVFVLLLLSTVVGALVYKNYLNEIEKYVHNGKVLENHINSYTGKVIITGWARSEDFAKLWIRDWGGVFQTELDKKNNLFEIDSDLINVRINGNSKIPLNNFCWDLMIVHKDAAFLLSENGVIGIHQMYEEISDGLVAINGPTCANSGRIRV